MIGRTLSHYKVLEKLGSGGMGEVYAAEDTKLGRKVALKILPPEMAAQAERRSRFEREAKAVAALDHPNIVTIHSVEESEGVHFYTMQLVKGKTLTELIPKHGLPLKKLFNIAIPLADAVSAAHEEGVIHRDLKPDNLMVGDDGRLRILDFGLAKLKPGFAEGASELPTQSATGEGRILGTVAYMSPEQAEGKKVDHRTDIFSIGVILYEMATGGRPFKGDTAASVISSILRDDPPEVDKLRDGLPHDLARIVRRCLEKDPARRFQSALDVRNELEDLEREHDSDSHEIPRAPTAGDRSPKKLWLGGVAVLALVAVAVGLYLANLRERPAAQAIDPSAIASIVALPSRVFGPTEEGYLTDAIPNTLSTHLTRVEGLETKVPPTSLDLERVGGDVDKVVDIYGVEAYVMTSITAEPERFVLTTQLVDAESRNLLWSGEFEGTRGTYIDLVRKAADGLCSWLRPRASPLVLPKGALSSEAELALRRGQYFQNRYNNLHKEEDFELGLEALQQALEIDPSLAQAAALIAFMYGSRWEAGDQDAPAELERWAKKAMELDSRNSLAWMTKAWAREITSPENVTGILEDSLKAAMLGPREAISQHALGSSMDRVSTYLSLAGYREAIKLEPLYLYPYNAVAIDVWHLGRPEEALHPVETVIGLEPNSFGLATKWVLLQELGRNDEADLIFERAFAVAEPFPLVYDSLPAYLALRQPDIAPPSALEQALHRLDDPENHPLRARWVATYLLPPVISTGQRELAFRIISRLEERKIQQPYDMLMLSPVYEPLRDDERFQVVLAKARSRFETYLEILDAARARGELPPYLEQPLADLRTDLGK
jgi:serine/threonine protein kinase/tetratricopeptide (TPR) repeat protein